MGIVKEEFLELAPKGKNLTDTVVLAQAWKKSHVYIRRHNWYADVLELDASTIDLENQLVAWGGALKEETFMPEGLRLVPAPKNTRWEFREAHPPKTLEEMLATDISEPGSEPGFKDWQAKRNDSSKVDGAESVSLQKLRPLAHLSIRDQTLATAVMMCLAESIETAQGDTSEMDFAKARERGIVSYGSRLQCQWLGADKSNTKAKFSWGNSRTYRQYFQDYRAFLARPRQICAQQNLGSTGKRELYVVSLDLKSFFDQVDTVALRRELIRLEASHRQRFGLPEQLAPDAQFWEYVDRIFSWTWRVDEHVHAQLINGSQLENVLPLGLPQGLVASGFLANAYLIGLDQRLNQASLGGTVLEGDIKLVDYCRYVDDIRVVVEGPSRYNGQAPDRVLDQVMKYVSENLKGHLEAIGTTKPLEFSQGKCTITPYRSMSAQGGISAMMELLQTELSGTFDLDSLVQAAGGLDGLLWMSDQLEDNNKETPAFRLSLATIAVPNTDVRDDTVKRFVASRLAQSLRERLAMTDSAEPIGKSDSLNDHVTQGTVLAHEFEATARKLIKCWAGNPSMVLLLRCGLDLYPHPKLLAPVLEALASKLFETEAKLTSDEVREVRVAQYALADLFRAGAVETGHRDKEEYPEAIDIAGYREDLAACARRILLELPNSPWYLQQQARLFLASVQDCSLPVNNADIFPELLNFANLRSAMLYEPVSGEALVRVLPFALVAQQIAPNPIRFAIWLREGLQRTADEAHKQRVLQWITLHQPELIHRALSAQGGRKPAWKNLVPQSLLDASRQRLKSAPSLVDGSEYSLLQIMYSKDNELGQENGLLALAKTLLSHSDIQTRLAQGLTAAEIRLTCNHWKRLQSLDDSDGLKVVSFDETSGAMDPLYAAPSWVREDKVWLYGLGRILRAALTGEFDFTSRRYLLTEDVSRYSGLRSTWFKRRFGLLNNGRGLLDEPAPVSPWLSGFLSTLLQWPGVDFHANGADGVADARTPAELLGYIEARIAEQRALYGPRSSTPMYAVPTDSHGELTNRPLRIAIVQPLRPRLTEFDVKDPSHWTKGTLAAHRRHLAEVCKLAHQQLRTWASAKTTDPIKNDDVIVDIVLFPELAVHPEHVFLLRRLSDKLRANIFAGLTFLQSDRLGAPINQGLWIIRTEEPGHGRSIQYAWQGKKHPMELERAMGVKGYRPHITLLELPIGMKTPTRVAAAICYDATDLDLVTDLRDRSDIFLVAALNKDVQTFDTMVAALHFHMYQPVVLANAGEFGGSTAQAPMPKHDRLLSHVHGNNQLAINVFEIDPVLFKSTAKMAAPKEVKAPPAGYRGRPR